MRLRITGEGLAHMAGSNCQNCEFPINRDERWAQVHDLDDLTNLGYIRRVGIMHYECAVDQGAVIANERELAVIAELARGERFITLDSQVNDDITDHEAAAVVFGGELPSITDGKPPQSQLEFIISEIIPKLVWSAPTTEAIAKSNAKQHGAIMRFIGGIRGHQWVYSL